MATVRANHVTSATSLDTQVNGTMASANAGCASRPASMATRSSAVEPPCEIIKAPARAIAWTAWSNDSGRDTWPAVSSNWATECSGR